MADKKKEKATPAAEDVVYTPAAEAPVVLVEKTDATNFNTLSVVSVASAATGFGAVAGVITGHVALSQIRHSGEKGRGLAIAGLVAGYAGLAGFVLVGAIAAGGHWAQNRFVEIRGGFNQGQISGFSGNHFGDDDNGFGMLGGRVGGGDQQGQFGQSSQGGQTLVVPNGQSGQIQVGPDGGSITIDGNGNSTITLPNGQTITLPDGNGMMGQNNHMGGKGFIGGSGNSTAIPVVPNS